MIKKLSQYINGSQILCRHNYGLVDRFEMMSEFDIVVANGKVPNTWNSQKRMVVTDYKCNKCSKIKRLQAVTPS